MLAFSWQRAMQAIENLLKKNIENSNKENIDWKVTVVNKCLTLKSAQP